MTRARIRLGEPGDSSLLEALEALVAEFEIPDSFPSPVLEQTLTVLEEHARGQGAPEQDEREIEFVTIDPATSTDLDQALYLEAFDGGYRVRYAIADVPSFVELNSPLDEETRRRGQTIYLPHRRIGLHPPQIAEDAGSLLPGVDRWAYVFTFELDENASVTGFKLSRAFVRSRAKLSYASVQEDLDSGSPSTLARLLEEIGQKRIELERSRKGASLNVPEQEVSLGEDGSATLTLRAPLKVEDYNAQISLMTGMATAELMIKHGAGILRTMPSPDQKALDSFRAKASALGVPWPENTDYGEFLRSLDSSEPSHLSVLHAAGSLFRGAGYLVLDGTQQPSELIQSAIGAPYTHTTAPLRRLVDRFVLLCAHALSTQGTLAPDLREVLPLVPEIMKRCDQKAGAVERASIDLVEAAIARTLVGQRRRALVISSQENTSRIQIIDPPIIVSTQSALTPGESVDVEIMGADLQTRKIDVQVLQAEASGG